MAGASDRSAQPEQHIYTQLQRLQSVGSHVRERTALAEQGEHPTPLLGANTVLFKLKLSRHTQVLAARWQTRRG